MRKFEVENVNCQNCVNLIKASLEDEFGKIEIDLNAKTLSLDITENKLESFKTELNELGFVILKEC